MLTLKPGNSATAPAPPWPPEMQVLARRVRDRQDAAAELYDVLDEEPQWPEAAERLDRPPESLATAARDVLGVTFAEQSAWRDPKGYQPLRHWIDAVEALGILVMQDGTLPVETMRGFASTHPTVPAIVVNTKDDARARAFTIIHELGHLALTAAGRPAGPQTEPWCDAFAGLVLMPPDEFARSFSTTRARDLLARIDEVALTFGVTPMAAAVTAARRELMSQRDASAVLERIRDRGQGTSGSGGNYYRTQIGRLGPAFTQLVLSDLDGQALTYPAASSMLGVKVNNFDKLREYVSRRAELE
jgi:Zn-dependent peptidase ImmA (M78 family)